MSRRGSPVVQVLIVVAVVCLFLYGFYCYHDQNTRLKHSEETVDKLKQKTESLSAQLQVLYEHKTRLEANVQQEKELHKKTKEGLQVKLTEVENKLTSEKTQCDGLKTEVEQLKTKAQESTTLYEKLEQDYKQLKQECANDIARLTDDVANNKRHYDECQKQAAGLPQQPVAGSDNLHQQREDQQQAQQHVMGLQREGQQQPQQPLIMKEVAQQENVEQLRERVENNERLENNRPTNRSNNEQLAAINNVPVPVADDYENDIEKTQQHINKDKSPINSVKIASYKENKDGLGL